MKYENRARSATAATTQAHPATDDQKNSSVEPSKILSHAEMNAAYDQGLVEPLGGSPHDRRRRDRRT
jgi:hypothetical protein